MRASRGSDLSGLGQGQGVLGVDAQVPHRALELGMAEQDLHQQGEWRKGGTQTQAIGRSRGGLTTKIVALADALGNLVRFVLLPGQRHDTVGVPPLIEGMDFEALLGDKAFDVDWIRADLDARGAVA